MDQRYIGLLNTLGFSHNFSCQEVQRYEYSVMADQSHQHNLRNFLLYLIDNANFNVYTIDGHYTFHGIGGIQCTTPTSNTDLLAILQY